MASSFSSFSSSPTYTLTFGDQAENHVGMEKLGEALDRGLTLQDLTRLRVALDGFPTELYDLSELLDDEKVRGETEPAHVLVIRQGLAGLLTRPEEVDAFFEEQHALPKDEKAKMYGRVVNKHARHNLCFSDVGHPANYEAGLGTVIPFTQVPLLSEVRERIRELIGHRLVAEGNYYHNPSKCGIGYHGDSERRIVVGIRVGATMPLHFRWYHQSEVISRTRKLSLAHGDVYVMSDKAVGHDWKLRTRYTLRHAAGSAKFLDQEHDR